MAKTNKKTKKVAKKAVTPAKKKTSKTVKKKAAASSKKRPKAIKIKKAVMSPTQVQEFMRHLESITDGTIVRSSFDCFLLAIFDPSSSGKGIYRSYYSVVITHNDPIQSSDVGIDINRIDMKKK
jgi:hypothetical protein